MRILSIESPRFPGQGSSAQGQSGPKPRLKSVGDGQQVEIPVLDLIVMRDGVTQKDKRTRQMEQPGQAARLEREANPLFYKAEL